MTEEEILPAQGHPQAHGGRGGLKGRPRGRLRSRLSVSAPGQCVCPAALPASLGSWPRARAGLRLPGTASIGSLLPRSRTPAQRQPDSCPRWSPRSLCSPSGAGSFPWLRLHPRLARANIRPIPLPTPWIPSVLASCISFTQPLPSFHPCQPRPLRSCNPLFSSSRLASLLLPPNSFLGSPMPRPRPAPCPAPAP